MSQTNQPTTSSLSELQGNVGLNVGHGEQPLGEPRNIDGLSGGIYDKRHTKEAQAIAQQHGQKRMEQPTC